jgi:DNA-binding NarL/FixJ family response regulator
MAHSAEPKTWKRSEKEQGEIRHNGWRMVRAHRQDKSPLSIFPQHTQFEGGFMTDTPAIQVFLADDHPVVREGLQALFAEYPEFKVVGEAGDGLSAVTLFASLQPDVALIDLRMPGQDGIATIKALRAAHPKAGLLALTSLDGDTDVRNVLAAGADGFLSKGSHGSEVLEAVRTVYAGGRWISPKMAALLDVVDEHGLSAREYQVIELMATGLRNQEIADRLFVSLSTVKAHVNAIMEKLDAQDRTEAVVTALRRGIIHLPPQDGR